MSRILDCGGIPTSLGEIINIKYHLDLVKSQYDQIFIGFHTQLWDASLHTEAPDWAYKRQLWVKFLSDIGKLFFSEPPYVVRPTSNTFSGDTATLMAKLGIQPHKIEMAHLLCKGTPLNVGEEYIVVTTKVRQILRRPFLPQSIKLWEVLSKLSKKYKIVILGERVVEMRKEYGPYNGGVFGIYDELIANLPADRVLDLTVPALGETVSDLSQIQQDCLIMNQAKFVVTLGVGGNFCMSTSVARMAIGYRTDNLDFANKVYSREYPNAIVTKDWAYFIQVLERYL